MNNRAEVDLDTLRSLLLHRIATSEIHEWSLQGLGMFRMKLPGDTRLHVWSRDHQVSEATPVHNHPWHLFSTVIAGYIDNTVYSEDENGIPTHLKRTLHCGEGCHFINDGVPVRAEEISMTRVYPGESYYLDRSLPHSTTFKNGTVSMCHRTVPENWDPDQADIYIPIHKEFVSAEPRSLTSAEFLVLLGICAEALI